MYENVTADRRECVLSVRRKPKQDMIRQNSMHEPFSGYQPQPIPPSQPSMLRMDLPPPGFSLQIFLTLRRLVEQMFELVYFQSFAPLQLFDDSTPTDRELRKVKVDGAGAAPRRDTT
ncbi:uncharacterized protein EDB91DRAFT_1088042 [Suillus paluster]|uniref:uncharacterized protein n=1 Tax=Suillus paluster TaxID=48578 RepID=UPI001B8762D4|nr:uncharacterized protein EDB91DRAFT_1088042 [Suillus paluster]KAG1722684.1 hypothetical protein EDB91DRAFT_1088042 [Suillus paluster]